MYLVAIFVQYRSGRAPVRRLMIIIGKSSVRVIFIGKNAFVVKYASRRKYSYRSGRGPTHGRSMSSFCVKGCRIAREL